MALEAPIFSQDPFGYNLLGCGGASNWVLDEKTVISFLENQTENPNNCHPMEQAPAATATTTKRRRPRSKKNTEEIEKQRMTHIAVERNRRKQMNHYLSLLRSLMPQSYVQRSDQASIVGGAINFVKELEHKLHSQRDEQSLSEFFTFPQYKSCHGADIEVTMADSYANLKIRSKRRPKQLSKVVSGLHSLRLTTLHLSVVTIDQIVLYTLSLKVEDGCTLNSVDEIARAVCDMLGRIHDQECI